MVETTASVRKPELTEVTLEITMRLDEWKKFDALIADARAGAFASYPGSVVQRQIREAVRSIEGRVTLRDEEDPTP